MANVTISPNMGLPVPTVGVDPGPDWANNIVASLSILDGHSHVPGSGVQITPSGININTDLPFGNNNITLARSVRFTAQSAPLSLGVDIGCLYESGVDLYYNDGAGNQVRITQSGSVTGASGTITGLPSGTASASYSAGIFSFQSATSTPATLAIGPIILGNSVANSKTITIAPNAGIAANYNLTLPAALPGSVEYLNIDGSGNVSYNTSTGSGSVVLASSPTISSPMFTGIPTGVIAGGTYSPTINFNHAVTVTSQTWSYYQIGSSVTVSGTISWTCITTGTFFSNMTLPISTISTTSLNGFYCDNLSTTTLLAQMYNNGSSSLAQIRFFGNSASASSGNNVFSQIIFTYQVV